MKNQTIVDEPAVKRRDKPLDKDEGERKTKKLCIVSIAVD